jgi:hypothetical protein
MSTSRAREIFMELVANVRPEQWQGRLAELAGGDAGLQGKVARLLAAHRQADSFLEQPAPPLGAMVDALVSAAPARLLAEPESLEHPGTLLGPYSSSSRSARVASGWCTWRNSSIRFAAKSR